MLHALDWQCERQFLLKNLDAADHHPNPGVMTGPGTNSYLVGDPRTGSLVIEPARPTPTTCKVGGRQGVTSA
jgi:recombination protein RecT